MILILSKKSFEKSTEKVIDWLDYLGGNYYRINGQDFYDHVTIYNGRIEFKDFDPNEVNIIWNRRWEDDSNFLSENEELLSKLPLRTVRNISSNITMERKKITEFFISEFEHCKWTTKPGSMSVNKLKMLEIAKNCELNAYYWTWTQNGGLLPFKIEIKNWINDFK